MRSFSKDCFQKFDFSPEEMQRLLDGAARDLEIAEKGNFIEVRFTYAYQALLKSGIALIAREKGLKVRAVPGHHVQVLSGLSLLLKAPRIEVIGNAMRMKRNTDLYGGGEFFSDKQVDDYLKFVTGVVKSVQVRCKA